MNADTAERRSDNRTGSVTATGLLKQSSFVQDDESSIAPAANELTFHYQPIFDANGRAVIHEALVRWHHPEGGVHVPVDFLAKLLTKERITGFTALTIANAEATLERNPGIACISINLSPIQLCTSSTLDRLSRLNPATRERLMVEVTEDPIPDREAYHLSIGETANLGVEVVLDDVVPEDVEQRLLRGLAVSGIKLDRTVLSRLVGEGFEQSAAVIIKDLRKLKLDVTVEGIDDMAVLPQLARLGATRFQGFGLAMPGPYLWSEQQVRRD